MNNPVPNAILVFHSAGLVNHRFCEAEYAKAFLNDPANSGGSVFMYDNVNAETIYAVSPNTRDRVESAKSKLRSDLKIKAALDKHGVTPVLEVRHAVHEAFSELCVETVRLALAEAGSYSLPDYPAGTRVTAEAQLEQALNRCAVTLDGTLRQAVKAAFLELMAN
jgi:hypothetical protein